MTGSLNFPIFLYSLLGMLALGTFLTEAKYGPQTAILISGFYLASAYLQKWLFDSSQMFRKKSNSEAVDHIIFAGETLETEAEAAHEKRTLDKVLKLPVQIKLRIGIFGMVGLCVSLVLNHTLQMHFTLFFHLITALLILPAMTPNHFMLPCAVNLMAVVYGYASSDTPDVFLHAIYVLLFMFVIMSFGNVQRETRQTHAKPLALTHLTIRTLVAAVQTGVAYLLLMGIVDYFVPHPSKTRAQQRAGIKTTMVQFQALLGRAMPDSFRPAPGPLGAPSPPPFPLPSTLPSLSPEQVRNLAREALEQGLFDEKDLKRGEVNLKPEVQKFLTPDRVQQGMRELKKMAETARLGKDSGSIALRPAGLGEDPKENQKLEQGLLDVLKQARKTLADTQIEPKPGGPSGRPNDPDRLAALIDDLFTPVLAALILVAIWYFRRKLRKKADPRRVSRAQLARDQRVEILKRLKELSSGSLSAREEVIARYDLFLKIMEFAATPRETYLPPTDFQRRIRYLHPPLEGQSRQITDIFCDVFYGEKSPRSDEVKKSRGAVKEIYHYFAD